ncbi:MAG: M48 family metalloprotease [Fibrobacteres bacterium]|nr:M48 family metalloprotease [Fibrobacterota bacterium]
MLRLRTASALRYSAASVSLLLFVQCAGFFGGMGKMLVSEQDEMKLGAEFNKTLTTNDTAKREMPIFVPKNQAQAEMQTYIIGLAKEIVDSWPASQKPSYPFTYTLIDKDVENAFAVPGGYVYIYTGILKKLNDESELMGVLGHEITHVINHHYSRQLAENTTLGIALQTVLVASNAGQGSQMAAGAAFQLAGLKFSRSDETEADRGGTLALGRVQRNTLGIAKYFERAKSMGVPQWLSDHPGNGNRVKAITKIVNGDPKLKALADQGDATRYASRFKSHVSAL